MAKKKKELGAIDSYPYEYRLKGQKAKWLPCTEKEKEKMQGPDFWNRYEFRSIDKGVMPPAAEIE
jgi:hypothetical protein